MPQTLISPTFSWDCPFKYVLRYVELRKLRYVELKKLPVLFMAEYWYRYANLKKGPQARI
jgi:hypothetical protein